MVPNSNFITNSILYLDSTEAVPVQFDIFEVSEDLTSTPLTADLNSIDIDNDDHILDEFPALKAGTAPIQASKAKPEQSEAQKEAVRLLRQKFKYPSKDPPPNTFQDTRTEQEKVESILRMTSQILDAENLEIWNNVCERSLYLVRQHNSGIPLLKQNIMDQTLTGLWNPPNY